MLPPENGDTGAIGKVKYPQRLLLNPGWGATPHSGFSEALVEPQLSYPRFGDSQRSLVLISWSLRAL
jgi:hypothetical protein